MSPTFHTDEEHEKAGGKPRKGGTLPYLPDSRDASDLRDWLTRAFRPPEGWQLQTFERSGILKTDPAALIFANGREHKTFRFSDQRDLMNAPRQTVATVARGWLATGHLTPGEVEDVWMALCTLGQVMTEYDEPAETREWIEQMLPATLALHGYTLVPDGRHDALMALRAAGQFTKGDAMALIRNNGDDRYLQRPTRFIDGQTGDQWVRAGETATYVRYVIGVEPLSGATLRARLHEVGVLARLFEDYRPPHPKLQLYQLTEELIEGVE